MIGAMGGQNRARVRGMGVLGTSTGKGQVVVVNRVGRHHTVKTRVSGQGSETHLPSEQLPPLAQRVGRIQADPSWETLLL